MLLAWTEMDREGKWEKAIRLPKRLSDSHSTDKKQTDKATQLRAYALLHEKGSMIPRV